MTAKQCTAERMQMVSTDGVNLLLRLEQAAGQLPPGGKPRGCLAGQTWSSPAC